MPTTESPVRIKNTKFPPAMFRAIDKAKSEEAKVGAMVRIPEASICATPLVVPSGPPSGMHCTRST